MKNAIKTLKLRRFGLIAVAVTIGFFMAACDNGSTGGPVSTSDGLVCIEIEGTAGIAIIGYTGSGGSVNIPESIDEKPVIFIDEEAFKSGQLTGVIIPESVISIGNGAFANNQLTGVIIPESVTSIGDLAFDANQLTSVTIPAGVVNIGNAPFIFNPGLTKIDVSPDNPNYCSADGVLYNKDITILIQWPAGNIDPITIPGTVTEIGSNAFFDNLMTGIIVPDGVTTIMGHAFSSVRLTSVTIGANVALLNSPFGLSGFENVYNDSNKAAGTYTRTSAGSVEWVKE